MPEAREQAEPSLLTLAQSRFPEPTTAEERLFRECCKGEFIRFTNETPEEIDPGEADSWGDDRTIHAECIEWLCTDNHARQHVHRKGIQILGAKIEGVLHLEAIDVPFSLALVKSSVAAGLLLHDAELRGLHLKGSYVGGIQADRLRVTGSVFLSEGFKAEGEVRLVGATIGGQLSCIKGTFLNKGGDALSCDRMQVTGSVFLRDGFKAEGEVRLVGATIGSNLECGKGTFLDKGGDALSCDGMQVTGSVFLREGFKAEGRVSLMGAHVSGGLQWHGVRDPSRTLMDLRTAKTDVLWDEVESWPSPGNLYLDGFCYGRLSDHAPLSDKQRIAWLRLQPTSKQRGLQPWLLAGNLESFFWPQPYEQLAKVLKAMGHERASGKVQIAKNNNYVNRGALSLPNKVGRWFLRLTTGYGYRPWRALWIGLFLVGVGWGLFHVAGREGIILHVEADAFSASGVQTGSSVAASQHTQPDFHPLLYAADVFLPVITFSHTEQWAIDTKAVGYGIFGVHLSGFVLAGYQWGLNFAGWIVSALFIAGITGAVRRRM